MASTPFRIPLGGPYTTRVSAVNASDTTSGYVGVGIVGLMIVGATTQSTDKDARYINCFQQKIGERTWIVKRAGFGTFNTPEAGSQGYAILVWTGQGNGDKVISAFGATNSTIYDSTSSLGAITGRCTGITETFVTTTPTLTFTSNDSTGWYYDVGTGTVTKIVSANFPGNAGKTLAGTFCHMDGFAIVMTTDANLYASDLNSVTGWTANSFAPTNVYSDKGVGCVRHKNFVMAFGTESIEFWQNAGLTPFPLQRANNMTIKVGAVSADAIAQIADTTFWAGSAPQGGLSVFQYGGDGLSRISTPEIDAQLILAGASNISLTTIRNFGRSFVLVKAGATTYTYLIEEKFWHQWTTTTPLWYKCAAISMGGTMVNYAISNVSTSGKVYIQNHASLVFTDDSVAYSARIQLPPMDLGTMRMKHWENVEVVGDVESSASTLTISYTDDDYNNYTTRGTVDLSLNRRRLHRCGSSRRRGWVLTHSANTPMRLEALEGNVSIGPT